MPCRFGRAEGFLDRAQAGPIGAHSLAFALSALAPARRQAELKTDHLCGRLPSASPRGETRLYTHAWAERADRLLSLSRLNSVGAFVESSRRPARSVHHPLGVWSWTTKPCWSTWDRLSDGSDSCRGNIIANTHRGASGRGEPAPSGSVLTSGTVLQSCPLDRLNWGRGSVSHPRPRQLLRSFMDAPGAGGRMVLSAAPQRSSTRLKEYNPDL